jgi:hypothetical protein
MHPDTSGPADFPADTLTGDELTQSASPAVDDKQRHDEPSAGAQTVGALRDRASADDEGVEPVHEVTEQRQVAVDREAAAGPSI